MGLKDKIVKALALRYARGKASDLRGKDKDTTMGKILKALDGYKLLLGVALLFGAKLYDAMHNGHTGDMIGAVIAILGWTPDHGVTDDLFSMIPKLAAALGTLFTVIGSFHKLYKAWQQKRSGAPLSATLSKDGYVAQAIAEAVEIPTSGPEGK